MKYYKLHNKEQEAKGHLLTDTFGAILGDGLYTSVVKPLPRMKTNIIGRKMPEMIFRFIFKKPNDVVIKLDYINDKACVS